MTNHWLQPPKPICIGETIGRDISAPDLVAIRRIIRLPQFRSEYLHENQTRCQFDCPLCGKLAQGHEPIAIGFYYQNGKQGPIWLNFPAFAHLDCVDRCSLDE